MEGKWRVEGKRGSRKRPRVMVEEMEVQAEELEKAERSQKENCNVLTLILFSLFTNRIWTRYIINGFLSDTSVRVMYKSEVA